MGKLASIKKDNGLTDEGQQPVYLGLGSIAVADNGNVPVLRVGLVGFSSVGAADDARPGGTDSQAVELVGALEIDG